MHFIEIAHKKAECIGCGLCTEIAADYWYLDAQGEAQLLEVTRRDDAFEYAKGLPLDRDMLESAESGCPVNIIRIR